MGCWRGEGVASRQAWRILREVVETLNVAGTGHPAPGWCPTWGN
jgi:hypothetical protein